MKWRLGAKASRLLQPNTNQSQKFTPKEIKNYEYYKEKNMSDIEVVSYLNLRTVALYTGLSAATILAAAKTGSFPSSFQFDDDEVWLSADIADWLENSPHSPSNFAWRAAS